MRDTLIPVGILLAGLAIIVFLTTTSASRAPIPTEAEALPVAEAVRPVLDDYGLPVDLETVSARVPRNATFSDLIVPHGIAYERVVTLAASARPTFDVRRIQAGRPYRIYKVDSTQTARFLVYEPDRTSYVVFDLGDEGAVERVERPVETQVRTVEGTISSSLYVTLMEQDVHPELATRMSEVFAWQVDFYRIQPGDSFRIVFEERRIDGETIGIGDIQAAKFKHFGNDFYAFRYVNEETGIDEHYDEKGNSLRKAFLMAPVDFSRISSGFSPRRFHPVQKRYKAHLGTDYAAPRGTPIKATGDGVVTTAAYGQYNGNYVKVRHNGTYTTQYLHMSKIASGIRPGVKVRQGQVIGYVGATGLATGNHVCYRFWKNGQQVNHRQEDFPSVGPVPNGERARYAAVQSAYKAQLDLPLQTGGLDPNYAMLLGAEVRATL